MPETDGSIEASFQFISYKVDEFHFVMNKDLQVLLTSANFGPEDWDIELTIRTPIFHKSSETYISGIGCKIGLRPNKNPDPVATMEMFVTGAFKVTGELPDGLEDKLVKYQMPSILFPYLRGSATSFLANAGFGSVILPLINVPELAKDLLKDQSLQIIGDQS